MNLKFEEAVLDSLFKDGICLVDEDGNFIRSDDETKEKIEHSVKINDRLWVYENEFYYENKKRTFMLNDKKCYIMFLIDVTEYCKEIYRLNQNLSVLELENEDLKIDKITNLPTRLELENYIDRVQKNNKTKIFVMCDIDDFKYVNDTYGHSTGDFVLNRVGTIFKNNIRSEDFVGRYGGEEFLIIFDTDDMDVVLNRLEVIRYSIKNDLELLKKNINITISFGVSVFEKEADIRETIQNADKAVYHVKGHGKNGIAEFNDKTKTLILVNKNIYSDKLSA